MAVLDRFAQGIPDEIQQLGRACVEQGGVHIRAVADRSIEALVTEEEVGPFRTNLDWSGDTMGWSCNCGGAEDHVCLHVVALALAAEAGGHLPVPMRETRPRGYSRPGVWLSSRGEIRRMDRDEPRPVIPHQPAPPSWKKLLMRLKEADAAPPAAATETWPADRQILYIIDLPAGAEEQTLVVRLACRDPKANGEWSRPKTRGIAFPEIDVLRSADDQQILALLKSGNNRSATITYDPAYRVSEPLRRLVVPMICRTGRCLLRTEPDSDELPLLAWDEGPAWEFWVEARREETTHQYVFAGTLRRGDERVPISRPLAALPGGVVLFADRAALLDDGGAIRWLLLVRSNRAMQVPFAQSAELLTEMLSVPHLPRLELPEELRVETIRTTPRPHLRIRTAGADEYRPERLRAELVFDYDGAIVHAGPEAPKVVVQAQRRRLIVRDLEAEKAAAGRLRSLGLRDALDFSRNGPEMWFNHRHLPRLVRVLVNEGWHIDADGKLYRQSGRLRLNVSSGIDWFELRGEIDFEGHTAKLPDLLRAMRRGETAVQLDDGTFGMLPEAWLKRYAMMAGLATEEEEFLRFAKNQAGLLDALLASQPEATWDETYDRTRTELRNFDGIRSADAPAGFSGELRPYQRDGLGWFDFLRRFGFGGCLADDMGLGKTVQVLALLEARREQSAKEGRQNLSLVVVPKSLVFNWQQEASRFTPKLRILDHTGIDRLRGTNHLMEYDLVITTYGTLRRDVTFLKDVEFDYVVLDEAQAIKNPASESAKAVRLVKGCHRLVLSGTPVQNHLGDLWSLFDFLNPGMLGAASVFSASGSSLRSPDEDARGLLAKALRPFILRRTKEQVASDLPAKLEQTLYCELDNGQRKLYDELREHYRRSLLEQIDRDGLNRSKMQILEALLRLRQAALHPGLIDPARNVESSAKLDVLLSRLEEVIDEGHKALVFSQFTSMLSIVRQRLDSEKIVYEYLDGKTTDRGARVDRFQQDENCKLFLISLKAGGLGLNLTAADYVFLLDPWWNPAVEQQAIDRAHRIGQTRQVYACRLIAKDTVEEKVLALQQGKRELADAIITADNSLIRTLGRDDLELLLS